MYYDLVFDRVIHYPFGYHTLSKTLSEVCLGVLT